jgi:hypothetical protein
MVALADAPAQFVQWEPGSDDKEHWLFAATVPRDVLRVREDYKSYTDRVGKNWDVFFDAPGASVHAARGELASPTRHYCTNADCSHTFVPVRHSSSGLLKIFREWVRPGESGHGATVHAPSDTFNCPYWGLHDRDPNAPLTDVEPSSKREFGYGGNWNDVSGEIVSYHVSKVLRMWIVPPGKIVSFGSSGFPEWFSEHFCTTREAMRAYFHSDDKMEHARQYGWLQVHARARARHRHTHTHRLYAECCTSAISTRPCVSTALTGVSCHMSTSAFHVHCAHLCYPASPPAAMAARRWRHAVGAALPRDLRERHPARDCCAAANWPVELLSEQAADRPALPLHGNAPIKGTQNTPMSGDGRGGRMCSRRAGGVQAARV